MHEALQRAGTPLHAAELEPLIPEQSVSLGEIAVWVTQSLLRTEPATPEQARLLNNLGNRLSDLGHREEALAAAKEAVEIYRTLAKDRPDAFLPDLAGSLNNLGGRLSALGHREEELAAAKEAVEIYVVLVRHAPAAFGRNLSISLRGLIEQFEECGRPADAMAIVTRASNLARDLKLQP